MVGAEWTGFNVLHTAAARVGGMVLGFVPEPGGRDRHGILTGAATGAIDTVFLLGADALSRAWTTTEVPIGIVTELIGIPAFLLVLGRARKAWA